jgi:hypothetical protein
MVEQGVQTGDGRVIATGALQIGDVPMPLAWLERQMHGDLLDGGVQVGNIYEARLDGDGVAFRAWVDDEVPEGAEMVRRMEAGTAPNGNRFGISIDPDNWAVEIVATDAEEGDDGDDELLLACAGRGQLLRYRAVAAAAGEPDPGDDGTVLLFTDRVDSVLERYTMLRIRGATACAIGAFTTPGCYLELDPDAAEVAEPEPAPEDAEAVVAAAVAVVARPPADVFAIPEPDLHSEGLVSVYGMPAQELLVEQPDGGLAVPFTVAERGDGARVVFGHAARWGQCHVGYPGTCVSAPDSPSAYAHFHHGEVVCADGSRAATGTLTIGCDHAAAELRAPEARDHYANSGLAFADVRASSGALGVWVSGVLRPDVTDAQLRLIRASSLSGDWRRIGGALEFIGALAVNVPGFPIAREAVTAAIPARVPIDARSRWVLPQAQLVASAYVDDGVQLSLTAAGVVQRCPECQRRAMAARHGEPAEHASNEALAILRRLDARTRHLVPVQAAADLAVIRRPAPQPAPEWRNGGRVRGPLARQP